MSQTGRLHINKKLKYFVTICIYIFYHSICSLCEKTSSLLQGVQCQNINPIRHSRYLEHIIAVQEHAFLLTQISSYLTSSSLFFSHLWRFSHPKTPSYAYVFLCNTSYWRILSYDPYSFFCLCTAFRLVTVQYSVPFWLVLSITIYMLLE